FQAACKGDAGPMGPAGPVGPQGPAGPAGASGATNRADLSGVFTSSGTATGLLPAAAVSGGKVPAISCYISQDGATWLAVAQVPATSADTYCGLTGIGSASPGITIVNGI